MKSLKQILLALLALAPASPAVAQTQTAPAGVGVLRVKTDVAEALVVLDDREVGQTPLTLRDVSVGKHRLMIVKDGFEDHSQEVEVTSVKTASVFAVMKPERSQMPEVPVTFRVLHHHFSGSKCFGKLTVTAESVDYDAENDADKFHIPLATIKSVSRSWGPYRGVPVLGIKGSTDSMAFRIETPGRSYNFRAFRETADDKPDVISVETKNLFTTVYKLWAATLKSRAKN
jgi:hypothetical protein